MDLDTAINLLQPLIKSKLFNPEEIDNNSVKIEMYAALDAIEKLCANAKKRIYDDIHTIVDAHGTGLENGAKEIQVGDITITRQRKQSKEPDQKGVEDLMAAAGLTKDKIFDEVRMWVYNPSKVSLLVERGFIDEAKIDSLRKVTFALTPTMAKRLKDKFTAT